MNFEFNLKSFPVELMDLDLNPNYKRVEEWYEGFKKEVEKQVEFAKEARINFKFGSIQRVRLTGIALTLLAILGEEPF